MHHLRLPRGHHPPLRRRARGQPQPAQAGRRAAPLLRRGARLPAALHIRRARAARPRLRLLPGRGAGGDGVRGAGRGVRAGGAVPRGGHARAGGLVLGGGAGAGRGLLRAGPEDAAGQHPASAVGHTPG